MTPVTDAVTGLIESLVDVAPVDRVRCELALRLAALIDAGSKGLEGIAAVARELRATLSELAVSDADDDAWSKLEQAISQAR